MNFNEFKDAWNNVQELGESVKGMSEHKEDDATFLEFYRDFRHIAPDEFSFLFQDYNPEAPNADNAKQLILRHAGGIQEGVFDNAINNSTNDLEAILSDAQPVLGEKLPSFVAMSMEPRVDNPAPFVDRVNDYRNVMKPLQKDSADPQRIKTEMKQFIDDNIGADADADIKSIAEVMKKLYNHEDFAHAAYIEIKVRPKEEALRAAIEAGNDWKTYMAANVNELKKPEKFDFYSNLYANTREN